MHTKELTIHVHILSRCEVGSDRALWGLVSIQCFQVFFCAIYRLLCCKIRGKLLCSYVNTDDWKIQVYFLSDTFIFRNVLSIFFQKHEVVCSFSFRFYIVPEWFSIVACFQFFISFSVSYLELDKLSMLYLFLTVLLSCTDVFSSYKF